VPADRHAIGITSRARHLTGFRGRPERVGVSIGSYVIERTDPQGGVTRHDALATVRQAVADWRAFFAAHNLDELPS
jgi:hypothetical protein